MAEKYKLNKEQLKKKKKLEYGAIIIIVLGLIVLTLIQKEVLILGPQLSSSHSLITLVSINFSILLMALLVVLILRSLYRIFFERQPYGSLQTKMVVAFISLSLVPTLLIFYYSYSLIVSGHDMWFSPKIELALKESLNLTEQTLELDNSLLNIYGNSLYEEFKEKALTESFNREQLEIFLKSAEAKYSFSIVELYNKNGDLILSTAQDDNIKALVLNKNWFVAQNIFQEKPIHLISTTPKGEVNRLVWLLKNKGEVYGYLAAGRVSRIFIASQMEDVKSGLLNYQNALNFQKPFKVTQLTALAGMTLLAIFISIWIGSHLARSLSKPVLELVEGTKKVASGDLEFKIESSDRSGEFADLVASFNQMTFDLKQGYAELDRRRKFLEIVLKNVATGVIVLDTAGLVTSYNKAAQEILQLQEIENFPFAFEEFKLPDYINNLVKEFKNFKSKFKTLEKHLHVNINNKNLSLKINVVFLYAENKERLGFLIAFDDLSDLENAQRAAAWQEVARRIAHEVKNPLTPIQLATQRLKRRFTAKLSAEEDFKIFDECTQIIIRQVETMKNLVNEFSNFARLPEIKVELNDINLLVNQVILLYKEAHKEVRINLKAEENIPQFLFDMEQINRVLTNLLDNSLAAMNNQGEINITLALNKNLKVVKITVADNGPGFSADIMERVFEPYTTTKSGGQGLGLAISKGIINDHGGFLKLDEIYTGGACFIIELPLRF